MQLYIHCKGVKMEMNFTWDDAKNFSNELKHGVCFEEAQSIWCDIHSHEFFDEEHSIREKRYIRLGYSSCSRILIVVFTEEIEKGLVRIISARKAARNERKYYEERI